MTIFLNNNSVVVVQGITGSEGKKHTQRMLSAGTKVVAGTNPRKAGSTIEFSISPLGANAGQVASEGVSIPVLGTVKEAKTEFGANTSVVFVPPAFAKDAVIEAVDAGMELVVVITEGVPVSDSIEFVSYARSKGVQIIGPNCPGIISPGESNVGITPPDITKPGKLGLVSKSGTLTYQLMYELADIGFTTCIGIGGDPVVGTTHVDALDAFEKDPDTELIVMIGEIGGDAEEKAALYIQDNITKPVVAYVAGFTAPEGKTMGHAGAIISGSAGTAMAKKEALEAVGVRVGKTPSQTAQIVRDILNKQA